MGGKRMRIILIVVNYNAWFRGRRVPRSGYERRYVDNTCTIYAVDSSRQPAQISIRIPSGSNVKVIKADRHCGEWTDNAIRERFGNNTEIVYSKTETCIAYYQDPQELAQRRDPLIIIFTLEIVDNSGGIIGYPEWHKALDLAKKNPQSVSLYDHNNGQIKKINTTLRPRIAEIKINNNYTILIVKENEYEKKKGGIDDLLNKILEHNNWKNIQEIYVAVHDLDNYVKDVGRFKNENKINYICDFHHIEDEPDKSFCKLLVDLIDYVGKSQQNNALNKCKEIIEKIKELYHYHSLYKQASILKHRIMNLFLPIDIDLQGLQKSNFQENYIEEVINAWKGKAISKINEAREFIYGNSGSLKEIVEKVGLEKSKAWEKIEGLLPQSDEYYNVVEILKILNDGIKEELKSKEEWIKKENPFHKWFLDIDEALDEIRKELIQGQSKMVSPRSEGESKSKTKKGSGSKKRKKLKRKGKNKSIRK